MGVFSSLGGLCKKTIKVGSYALMAVGAYSVVNTVMKTRQKANEIQLAETDDVVSNKFESMSDSFDSASDSIKFEQPSFEPESVSYKDMSYDDESYENTSFDNTEGYTNMTDPNGLFIIKDVTDLNIDYGSENGNDWMELE